MDIFSVFTLLGGLAFFLYGMTVMTNGLEKMAGGKLESTLKKMTSNPLKSLLLGAGITIAIQSSSAMTVMLVGLVNSGIMQLGQTIGVIMGSNVGTTLTAWILSLAGIESDNVWIRMLQPDSFAPLLAFLGILLIMLAKNGRRRDVGTILIGFSVLMFGMDLMSDSVSPLADMPEFSSILTMFSNPLLGVLIGAVFTGIIQSSAASVGILQALSLTGGITYGMAIPIIMGQNIGTCVTSLLSSIGVNKNAKRVAAVHIYFNILGTVICLSGFYLLHALIGFEMVEWSISPVGVALVHSIFNILTTVLLLPFGRLLEKLAKLTVRDREEKESYSLLDERLLLTPSFAIAECSSTAITMAKLSRDTLLDALELLHGKFSERRAAAIMENEQKIDFYEDKLGTYLVKLSSRELTARDSNEVAKLLHCIGDFERIGDHAVNVLAAAREMHDKHLSFSAQATVELRVLTDALTDILKLTIRAFEKDDMTLAAQVEPLEQVIDSLNAELKKRHVQRLQEGICTIELGFVLSDLLNNYERVSDHCSNIAVCMIQIRDESFDTHGYLNEIKSSGGATFVDAYNRYRDQYALPSDAAEGRANP